MSIEFPPGFVLLFGAVLVPFLRGRVQAAYLVLLPVLSFALLLGLPQGISFESALFEYTLLPVRVDKLSLVFGYIFNIAAFIGFIYAWHVRDSLQHVAALLYAGSALSAVFAGDLVTLFIFWEMTGLSAVFLVWSRRTPRARAAGMRYLIAQVTSGVLLLGGILLHVNAGGTLAFSAMTLGDPATTLMFFAFGIKAAFPLLHNWLQDAYPESTEAGTVFLSAYTTKLAIYALARGFPGTPELVWIGAAMTAFPIFYAVIENDLRRVLTYSMNNQMGFMVVGIGIGGLGLNGAVAHAFADILFKAVLFMAMGAVLYRVGTVKGSELGGLYKSMPLTAAFCIVGACSISAFPLFSAFATKSLIIEAVAQDSRAVIWLILIFASAGVFHHSGIKIPYFAFFAHDRGLRCKEAPLNMLVAMGLGAALCVGIGVFPGALYRLLPEPMDYVPYTTTHVITQLQLLLFSALAFSVLIRTGLYPPELKSVNLDSDWVYRRIAPRIWNRTGRPILEGTARLQAVVSRGFSRVLFGPAGIEDVRRPPRPWQATTVFLMTVLALLIYLIIDFWRAR
ncbi:MAG: Na(+)/H(+) antiporter subunit D [Gemmatimonadetes bacterium]|nr:Na(+)/H(+) antiporter subunit D [Gemmatimonadota bacterium]